MRIRVSLVFFSLLVTVSLAAQEIHRATPIDQLLEEYHAAHPHMHDQLPIVADDFNASAAKAFTVSAHQFAFTITPSPFVVNQGDSVTIDFTSTDVEHGFFLETYMNQDVTARSGVHRTVNFIASTPGSFTFACTVSSCGTGHLGMVGTMVVNAAPVPPTITSITPASGPATGGTVVAITGTNFANGATVKFGDTTAIGTTFNTTSSLSAIAPVHALGAVTVSVVNPDGQSATFNSYTYTTPGPAITSVTPSSAPTAGGTPITISGANFVNGATVTIDGSPAASVNVVNATTITALTPPGPLNIPGNVTRDLVVRNPDGSTATLAGGFTYTLGAPTIAAISPAGATPAGGVTVAISGTGFTTALPTTVTFGGVAGTNVQVVNQTAITVVAPAHSAGTVDVVVTVGSLQATSSQGFSYQATVRKRRATKPR